MTDAEAVIKAIENGERLSVAQRYALAGIVRSFAMFAGKLDLDSYGAAACWHTTCRDYQALLNMEGWSSPSGRTPGAHRTPPAVEAVAQQGVPGSRPTAPTAALPSAEAVASDPSTSTWSTSKEQGVS